MGARKTTNVSLRETVQHDCAFWLAAGIAKAAEEGHSCEYVLAMQQQAARACKLWGYTSYPGIFSEDGTFPPYQCNPRPYITCTEHDRT
jgi:hypothetical protein